MVQTAAFVRTLTNNVWIENNIAGEITVINILFPMMDYVLGLVFVALLSFGINGSPHV